MALNFKTLICETDTDNLSKGRIAFWITFGISIYFWFCMPILAFPVSLKEILMASFVYNVVKKFAPSNNSNSAQPIDDTEPEFRRLDE